ncbi:MAG: hypothetical protein ABIN83_07290 [Sphingomicrobium sp.]
MSIRLDPKQLADARLVVPSPALRSCQDHNFELPTGLYALMAALLFGFLAILTVGLADPGLVVPMAINFIFLAAFFGVPTLFVRAAKDGKRPLGWAEFMERGIETATGHSSGREATVLALVLPFFIFCWAIAIVAIVATA